MRGHDAATAASGAKATPSTHDECPWSDATCVAVETSYTLAWASSEPVMSSEPSGENATDLRSMFGYAFSFWSSGVLRLEALHTQMVSQMLPGASLQVPNVAAYLVGVLQMRVEQMREEC